MFSQNIKVFKNAFLLGFIFGGSHLILSLLPQKYSSFQSAFLLGFIFNSCRLI